MSQFNQFQEKFEETYKDGMWEFLDGCSAIECPFKYELVHDGDEESYDSYGNEDSSLFRVYKFPEFGDILVGFYGTRQSYAGEEWNEYKEVKQQTITIQVYE